MAREGQYANMDEREITDKIDFYRGQTKTAVLKALETTQRRALITAKGAGWGFKDRTGQLRASIRPGKKFFDGDSYYGQASILAGWSRLKAQATVVEFGVRKHGTFHTQNVKGFGRRGKYAYLSTALASSNMGNWVLRNQGEVIGRFLARRS